MLRYLIALTGVYAAFCSRLNKLSNDKLNVHVAPHSHDDPGWLKTADQYYSGSNSSVYPASVQYIFDTVIRELLLDSDKLLRCAKYHSFRSGGMNKTQR